jgi:hypothetical protein
LTRQAGATTMRFMADSWDSGVFPHGDLTALADNLWWVKSAQKGMPLPRNMIVYRLPSGDLVLHSVACLDAARMAALERLGTPRWMIVPNEGHRTDAARWKARYPQLSVLAPSGARKKVEELIAVDATVEEALPGLGIGVHDQDGAKPPKHEFAYEVDVPGGKALVINDLLGNGPKLTGVKGAIFNLLGTGGTLGVPRIVRMAFVADKKRVRAFLERLAERPWQVITVSHGDPVTAECAARLREAAAKL